MNKKTPGFPGGSDGKESTCNAGNPGSIPRSGRSPGEGIGYPLQYSWASLVAQMVKNLPAMCETWVRSLDWEDPLEKGMATHSSILAWKIPWTEEPGRLQSMGLQRVRHNWVTFTLRSYKLGILEDFCLIIYCVIAVLCTVHRLILLTFFFSQLSSIHLFFLTYSLFSAFST